MLTTISKFTKLPLKQTKKTSPLIYLFEQARYQKMFVNLVEHVTGIYLDKKEEKKKIKLYNSRVLLYFPSKKMLYFML